MKKSIYTGLAQIIIVLILAIFLVFLFRHLFTKESRNKEDLPWHVRMLESEMKRNSEAWMLDFESKPKWNYTHGLVLMATIKIWKQTGEERYFDYVKSYYDTMLDDQGNIGHNYRIDNYNIDHIKPGINLFDLYDATGDKKYLNALMILREQLKSHPRTSEGGFWHKGMYPHQLWLDGVYMNTPFYSRYGKVFNEPVDFDDVLVQIRLVESKTRDTVTGLLYHAWDESRDQPWSDPETGQSPNFWGRAMGWYAMALVDVLDYIPSEHPGRIEILPILTRLMDTLIQYQDEDTGLWYQVVDQKDRNGNYLEASVSCMVAYTLVKGVNNNLLDSSYMAPAIKAWQGILDNLISVDKDGLVSLDQVCGVAGLGGNPYRDGSYEYYVNEIIRSNDPKGVGPFMLLSIEIEKAGLLLNKTY